MVWQGKIEFKKAITLNGKPHGIEHQPTLLTWSSSDAGRVVYAEDTGKLWLGTDTEWVELTPGGVGAHNHDDLYYTEVEVDDMFEGKNGEKQQVSWTNVLNKPSTFAPDTHTHPSSEVTYDNTTSGLSATDVKGAIDELDGVIDGIGFSANEIDYDNTTSGLVANDTQAAIDEIYSATTDPFAPTKVLHVDNNRSDSYAEEGSIIRPYKTLSSALAASSSGDTVIVMAGIYTEDISVPAGVSLVSHSLNKVTLQGNATFNGPGVPISIQGIIFTGTNNTLTIDCTANIFECYSYSKVVFGSNAHISANVFNINVDEIDADAVTYNGSGDLNMFGTSIKSKGNSHAVIVNSGRLAYFGGEIESEDEVKATVQCNGGTVVLVSSQSVNTSGSTSIDLSGSDGSTTSPNVLSGVICVGNVTCGSARTMVDGIKFIGGALSGSDLSFPDPVLPSTSGIPADNPAVGTSRFDAGTNTLYIYNGTDWVSTVLS